ncbi:aldo/keto reductase [Frankia sp. QA3]|uniref:aldo/keto reductase n=1 Tax=Frankia sp. QA3 TaxID=710111 RepID=UPI000269C19A|nr:aldo/keto reductase [Frankia sp. QA3]EIV92576.1 putative oxidoreductase, aryl-alcohol dehydrogenase like protein [Frankia sp. QA3]
MRVISLGGSGPPVGVVGLGCMGMSWGYDRLGRDDDVSVSVIHRAIELGCTLIDTADQYGPFTNEELVGQALRGRRDEVVLATKCGLVVDDPATFASHRDGRPEHIRAAIEASLRRLGTDHVDLYQLHRIDPTVGVEDTWGAMAELVHAGKATAIGLSEATVDEIERARQIHPVASVQSELSLWSREPLSDGVLEYCRKHDITFIAYSPLGRGFLAGTISGSGDLPVVDGRHATPRFQAEAIAANQAIVQPVRELAARRNVTAAQVALAWVLHQGEHVVAIPGTKTMRYLEDNLRAADLLLSEDALALFDNLPAPRGTRY